MRFNPTFAAGLALASASILSTDNILPVPLNKLLHVSPPMTSDSISMFPGRHPNHDGTNLDFLVPQVSRDMYFAQEGHRKAVHGSKHALLKATFKHPTVVLDQSDHLTSITCSAHSIKVCFQNAKARDIVEQSWVENTNSGTFHLVTYHRGCGDLTGHKRSYFLASQPVQNIGANCVNVPVKSIEEQDALESGEVSWGKYEDPKKRRRGMSLARGHIRAVAAGGGDGDGVEPGSDEIVDIDDNLDAAKAFFNTTNISADGPRPAEPIEFINDDGAVEEGTGTVDGDFEDGDGEGGTNQKRGFSIVRRNGVSEIVSGGLAALYEVGKKVADGAGKVVEQIGSYAVEGVTLIYEAFTTGIDRSYHRGYDINETLIAGVSNNGILVLGSNGYLVYDNKGEGAQPLDGDKGGDSKGGDSKGDSGKGKGPSKLEKGIKIACIKCGMEANFTIDGRFAFHVSTGITKGKIVVNMVKDAKASAHLGITVDAKYPLVDYKKQIGAVPISPITIPGLFTVGPQLSFSASFNIDVAGEVEVIIGGDVTLSKGTATLDLKDKSGCTIDGLVPSFEPVARAQGKVEVVAALGLPIALEIGVDVLNGKFKATVGLVDTPSTYISAGFSAGAGSPCNDGIEIRMGIKNKIEISAFEKWSLPLYNPTLYDKGLGCVTALGFDKDRVQPPKSDVFDLAQKKLTGGKGKLNVDTSTELRDLASRINSSAKPKYWSIIMDKEETSTLVSGKDGYIYLAKSEDKNELTAPWGTIDPSAGFYAFDSLGRVLSYDKKAYEKNRLFMAEIRVTETKKVPKNSFAAVIARLNLKDKSSSAPLGLFLAGWEDIRYPTFCKVSGKGLRLYATQFIVNKAGKVLDYNNKEYTGRDDIFTNLGVKKEDCRTVNLFSSGFQDS